MPPAARRRQLLLAGGAGGVFNALSVARSSGRSKASRGCAAAWTCGAGERRVAAQGIPGARASGRSVGESLGGRREGGLPVADHKLLTPVCSALPPGPPPPREPVMVFGTEATRERMAAPDPARHGQGG